MDISNTLILDENDIDQSFKNIKLPDLENVTYTVIDISDNTKSSDAFHKLRKSVSFFTKQQKNKKIKNSFEAWKKSIRKNPV